MFSIDSDKGHIQVLETLDGPPRGLYLGSYNEALALNNEGKAILDYEVKYDPICHQLTIPSCTSPEDFGFCNLE